MITEIDEAILGSLRKGLAGLVPPENVLPGSPDLKKKKCVSVENTDFTIEETGMTVSEVRYEEKEDRFDADGHSAEFRLSDNQVKEILQVEYPKGTFRSAPDDFTFDSAKSTVAFRDVPRKGKDAIRVAYRLDKPLGESRILNFSLLYTITVSAEETGERDRIALSAIETLYRDVGSLFKQGVDDIRLEKGYTFEADDASGKACVLLYNVTTSRRIDIVYPPIEKVEIKGSKK